MQFELVTTVTLRLQPQLQWLWYSKQSKSFILGDKQAAFALPLAKPDAPLALEAVADSSANLPIPARLYEEFAAEAWHGFLFLGKEGDLLRTLVFGPDYGNYLRHPASGLVLSLRSGSMGLLQETPDGFEPLDRTRTRGRSALAFAGHPRESLVAYGDNCGDFYAHRFDQTQFGKASKIGARQRKASRLDFVNSGRTLVIGGMGYLATLSYLDGKFALAHELSIAVRDFTWLDDREWVLVNQGLHGISAYRYDHSGFTKLGDVHPGGAVQQIAISACRRYLAASIQGSPMADIYAISP